MILLIFLGFWFSRHKLSTAVFLLWNRIWKRCSMILKIHESKSLLTIQFPKHECCIQSFETTDNEWVDPISLVLSISLTNFLFLNVTFNSYWLTIFLVAFLTLACTGSVIYILKLLIIEWVDLISLVLSVSFTTFLLFHVTFNSFWLIVFLVAFLALACTDWEIYLLLVYMLTFVLYFKIFFFFWGGGGGVVREGWVVVVFE